MKIALYGLACYFIGMYMGDFFATKENDFAVVQYNQMIRTCELTLSDNQKCTLVAVPVVAR